MSNLTSEQNLLLNFYIDQYNQTQTQIRHLNYTLDELRQSIHSLTNYIYPNLTNPIPTYIPSSIPTTVPPTMPTYSNYIPFSSTVPPNTINTSPSNINNISNPRPNPIISPISRSRISTSSIPYNYSYFYQPLTPQQLTSAQLSEFTRECHYSEIDDPINDNCPISLNPFNGDDTVTQIISCGHIFNSIDINRWFINHSMCPVCRHDLLNETDNSNTDISNNDISNNDISDNYNISNNVTDQIYNSHTTLFSTLANQILSSIENADNIEYDASNNLLIFETLNYRQ